MARQSPVRYSDEINDKLIKWMNETGYTIVQINGQRISTSPRIDRKPHRGCEVFVGKIPRDCYEDELFPVFQKVGQIHELRLMMMFSGTNRGYAFVMYECIQDAQRAVHQLDNFEIRRGHRIGVLPCVNNCRLFVGCFEGDDRIDSHLQEVLRRETDNVVSVCRRGGRNGRWYMLVEYSNHRAAAIARRELTPRRSQLFGPRVIVDWEIQLDRRGRKMALDQRRAVMPCSPLLKLYKNIGDPQFANMDVNEKSKLYLEKGSNLNSSKQVSAYRSPQGMTQSDSYQEIWIKDQSTSPELYGWPTEVLQLNALNQTPTCISEWYSGRPMIPRYPIKQVNLKPNMNPCAHQDHGLSNHDVGHSNLYPVYSQLMPRAHHSLMTSTDSGLYSDADSQRPLSSESSGSARSSFSVSNFEASTSSTKSSGSVGSSCSASWDQSTANDMLESCYSDFGNRQMVKKDTMPTQCPSWQAEDLSTYFPTDVNNNKIGIWSSRFQSQEDHELINNLFMKEAGPSTKLNSSYEDINASLRAFSLSCTDENNNYFGRAVQPPQSRYSVSTRGPSNNSSCSQVF